jgi:hypothetical protein
MKESTTKARKAHKGKERRPIPVFYYSFFIINCSFSTLARFLLYQECADFYVQEKKG